MNAMLSVKAMTPQEFSAFSFDFFISNGFLDKFQQDNIEPLSFSDFPATSETLCCEAKQRSTAGGKSCT